MTGDLDNVVPSPGVRAFHDEIEPPRVYVQLVGANHVNLIENYGTPSPLLLPTEEVSEAFLATYLSGDRAALAATLDDAGGRRRDRRRRLLSRGATRAQSAVRSAS